MAKKTLLKERRTNQDLYPVTMLECIADFPKGTQNQILSYDGTKPVYVDITTFKDNWEDEWYEFD